MFKCLGEYVGIFDEKTPIYMNYPSICESLISQIMDSDYYNKFIQEKGKRGYMNVINEDRICQE